jgi:osmotically inducible protein OsmC
MKTRNARAEWKGNLRAGQGRVATGSGAFDGAYSFTSRFEDGAGTNPEELLAAAHAGCFSMALAHGLTSAGYDPERIATEAKVRVENIDGAFDVPWIEIATEGVVPGLDENTFRQQAETAKHGCPVSKALAGPEIRLTAARLLDS